jgi:hypothetical protein
MFSLSPLFPILRSKLERKPPQQHHHHEQQLKCLLAEQRNIASCCSIYNRRKPGLGILQDEIQHQFLTFGGSYCFPMFWIIPVSVVAKNITIIIFSATTNGNSPTLRNRRSGIVI